MTYQDELADQLKEAEKALDLPEGFIRRLLDEDDWSFVIKGHALLEAAFTHLLTVRLGETELADLISHLELSGARVGKLAIASALGLTTKSERRFIRTFSELRNTLVHNVKNVDFSFASHLATLDSKQVRAFQEAFFYFVEIAPPDKRAEPYRIALADPKESIWSAILLLLAQIHLRITDLRLKQGLTKVYARIGKTYYEQNEGKTLDSESAE